MTQSGDNEVASPQTTCRLVTLGGGRVGLVISGLRMCRDAWWKNVCRCGVRGHVVLYIVVCALLYNG